jgi:transcriptional regulator with XRE-family HTH domain
LDAAQRRMARAALQIDAQSLAVRAGVSPTTIARLERGDALYPRTVGAIRAVLEAAGIGFTDGGAPGVRLRKA